MWWGGGMACGFVYLLCLRYIFAEIVIFVILMHNKFKSISCALIFFLLSCVYSLSLLSRILYEFKNIFCMYNTPRLFMFIACSFLSYPISYFTIYFVHCIHVCVHKIQQQKKQILLTCRTTINLKQLDKTVAGLMCVRIDRTHPINGQTEEA